MHIQVGQPWLPVMLPKWCSCNRGDCSPTDPPRDPRCTPATSHFSAFPSTCPEVLKFSLENCWKSRFEKGKPGDFEVKFTSPQKVSYLLDKSLTGYSPGSHVNINGPPGPTPGEMVSATCNQQPWWLPGYHAELQTQAATKNGQTHGTIHIFLDCSEIIT